MSFREVRNFTEIMRALGYPRLISMENFRKPNFELVADILYWMVKLYEPDTAISDRVEFENERVEFLTSIATLMATKARLKLNTKKLYASDGRAVQELLKLATLLYSATKSIQKPLDLDTMPQPIKLGDVRAARQLASEITQTGAKVYDLLANEAQERKERERAIRFLDQAASATDGSREQQFIERSIRELIDGTKQAVNDMKKECEELDTDERNIDMKIKKKQEELERTEKRLRSLENVRPQFMDEVEKLGKELQKHYDIYMEKYRNLDFLEHESEKYQRNEDERREEQERRLKKMRERLLKEEVDLLRGGRGGDEGDDLMVVGSGGGDRNGDKENRGGPRADRDMGRGQARQRPSGPGRAGAAAVQGNMRGHDSDDDSEVDDDDLTGPRGGGGGGRGDSDEELSVGPKGGRAAQAKARGPGPGAGAGARGGGGSDLDSDEFLDDDDDDDGSGDDGDEDDGSDENF